MTNIIGPIPIDSWRAMSLFHASSKYHKEKGNRDTHKKIDRIYQSLKEPYVAHSN